MAYREAYKVYAIARARAAGERVAPSMCAVRVAVSMKQLVVTAAEATSTCYADTWQKEELLMVPSSDAAEQTRKAVNNLTKAFVEAFFTSNAR